MNKIIGLFIVFMVTGCNTSKQLSYKPATEALKQNVLANWKGELPCADCEGIAYQLSLKEDGTFQDNSVYLGETANGFQNRGTWEINADSIIALIPEKNEKQYYKFNGIYLEMLDRDGKKITSPFIEHYRLHKADAEENAAIWFEKAKQGIDFSASGNEPFWSLDIDFNKSMHFKALNGLEIITPTVKGVKASDAPITRYHAETDQGILMVQLFRQSCTDNMSGAKSEYRVQVMAKKKADKDSQEFTGCGRFIGDYRLNDIWTLQRIGSKIINAKELAKGPPTLELQVNEGKAFGYGGCNRFSGSFEFTEDKIFFGPIASTKMACIGDNIETQYLNLLSGKTLPYKVSEEMLSLGAGETMLVFKKVD